MISDTAAASNLRLLFAGRAARSFAQSVLGLAVPLVLAERGVGPVAIGAYMTAGAAGGLGLTIGAAVGADRFGRRVVLALLALLGAGGAATFALGAPYAVLLIAGALSSIGRGGGAAAGNAFGPVFAVEQAFIADVTLPERRNRAFGHFGVVGVVASAAGALATASAARFGYTPLFWSAVVAELALIVFAWRLHEPPRTHQSSPRLSRGARRIIGKLAITNAVNGLAIGMLGPMFILWLHLRYGAPVAAISALFLIANLAGILPYLSVERVVARVGGAIRTVVASRTVAALLLIILPFSPTFFIAGTIFIIRTLINVVALPVRQNVAVGNVRSEERARTTAFSNVPVRLTSALGPTIAGAIYENGFFEIPLLLAGILQLANAGLFWYFFRGTRIAGDPLKGTSRSV